jgi:hypothetical protein
MRTKRDRRSPIPYHYRCTGREHGSSCRVSDVPGPALDAAVRAELQLPSDLPTDEARLRLRAAVSRVQWDGSRHRLISGS